jgi:LacI family transcriptional regulator
MHLGTMAPEKTRLKDIAKLAGVSIGTVDRVLHNRGEVAEQTLEKVRQILRETNYSPDVLARGLKSRKVYNLVSLLPEPSMDNAFWNKHPAGINKAIEELDLFRVKLTQVTFDMFNENDFEKKAGSVLSLEPDGVLLAPIFKSESLVFCRALNELKIPFVFVDGFIDGTSFLAYIGEDAYRSGRVAGHLADLITPATKDILIVIIARNIQNVQHLNSRIEGFFNYFSDHRSNKGEKIRITIPDPTCSNVKKAMDKAFTENPEIGSIYMSGSKSYLIASYLEEKGIRDVNLIGYDLLEKNISFLRSGSIKFLIGQRPEEQTYKAVKKLFEFISLNRIPENKEYLPVDIITSENVNLFT